jgi:hypothetical protein
MLPVMLRLDAIENERTRRSAPEWFTAKIHPECEIQSIEGMSGGPIFGFRKNAQGQFLFHVVALQSRWDENQRIIFGCSLPYFAEWLHQEMKNTPLDDPDAIDD